MPCGYFGGLEVSSIAGLQGEHPRLGMGLNYIGQGLQAHGSLSRKGPSMVNRTISHLYSALSFLKWYNWQLLPTPPPPMDVNFYLTMWYVIYLGSFAWFLELSLFLVPVTISKRIGLFDLGYWVVEEVLLIQGQRKEIPFSVFGCRVTSGPAQSLLLSLQHHPPRFWNLRRRSHFFSLKMGILP